MSSGLVDPNLHDRFILRQGFRLVRNQYEISLPHADDQPGQLVCYVRQATFKLREDIRFYSDATRTLELWKINARQRFDPRARYDVTTADGGKIGEIQKVFRSSLVRSTYTLFGPSGAELATATEANPVVAVLRRLAGLLGLIPILGLIVDFLPIPYHFVFMRDGVVLGSHRRQLWKLRDVYTVDMTPDRDRTIDRRLVLAVAVGMDALQAR